jgi:hypothetical protein
MSFSVDEVAQIRTFRSAQAVPDNFPLKNNALKLPARSHEHRLHFRGAP